MYLYIEQKTYKMHNNKVREVMMLLEQLPESSIKRQLLIIVRSSVNAYPITHLRKEDLLHIGFLANKVTNDDMDTLARKMGESFVENDYWQMLDTIGGLSQMVPKWHHYTKRIVSMCHRDFSKDLQLIATRVIVFFTKNNVIITNTNELVHHKIPRIIEDIVVLCDSLEEEDRTEFLQLVTDLVVYFQTIGIC